VARLRGEPLTRAESARLPWRSNDMKLFRINKTFGADEDGAVTVDWVVLTASLVAIGLIVLNIIRGGVYQAASDIYSGVIDASNL